MKGLKIKTASFRQFKHENCQTIYNEVIKVKQENGRRYEELNSIEVSVIKKGLHSDKVFHVTSVEHVTNTEQKAEVTRTFKVVRYDDLYDELRELEISIKLI